MNPQEWKEDFEKTLVPEETEEKKSQADRTGHSEAKLAKKMPSVFKNKHKSHTHFAHTKAVSKNAATIEAEEKEKQEEKSLFDANSQSKVSSEVESERTDAMSYLDRIIDTDGWGDKKNSKIFEMMKHNE
jgi:hypothetical protein